MISVPGVEVAPERGPADATLLDAVADLRRDVAATRLPLPLPGISAAEDLRRRLLEQLDDHLLPRLRELSAPAVVVVAGSTGAGKSTLVNSLLREELSPAGVLRPTTREPVLVHHPADTELLAAHPLTEILRVVESAAVPRGLVLVDAPDLDSLLESNRVTAHRLLEAADLWLFLTTAARYGDALPWDVLARAAERGTAIAMVLNRVPPDALGAIRTDLLGRLRSRGLAAVPLFLITDKGPHQGLLDERSVAPVRRWLTMVAGADRARSVIQRTQRGTLKALQPWVSDLAESVQAQVDAREALVSAVLDATEEPAERVAAAMRSRGVAAGPVRARWIGLAGGDGPLSGTVTAYRRRAVRAVALEELAAELRASAAVALRNARRQGNRAIIDGLRAGRRPGSAAVIAALTAAADAATTGAAAVAPTDAAAAGVDAAVTHVAVTEGAGTEAAGTDVIEKEVAVADVDAARLPEPAPAPETSAAAWLAAAPGLVTAAGAAGDKATARGVDRLVRGVGRDGAGTLAALAAAGLGGADAAFTRVVGARASREVVAHLREDLAARAAEQARAAAEPALTVLASRDLADDAAATLRLRLAVLRGLR